MASSDASAAPGASVHKRIVFKKSPGKTITGGPFAYNKPLDQHQVKTRFQIVAVNGSVKWKDHGSGDVQAALILSRGQHFKTQTEYDRLVLTRDARGSRANEFKTAKIISSELDQKQLHWLGEPDEYLILTYNVGDENCALTLEEVELVVEYVEVAAPVTRSITDTKVQRVKAFVVGNDFLGLRQTSTANFVKDARAMRENFGKWGVDTYFCENSEIGELRSEYEKFSASLEEDDVAIVFLASHGFKLRGKQYLLAKLGANGQTIEDNSLPLDDMAAQLSKRGTRLNVLLLDCRVAKCDATTRSMFGEEKEHETSPLNLQATPGTIISYASSPNDSAPIPGPSGLGRYVESLVRHLATPKVDIDVVLRRVGKQVYTESGGKQKPYRKSCIHGDEAVVF